MNRFPRGWKGRGAGTALLTCALLAACRSQGDVRTTPVPQPRYPRYLVRDYGSDPWKWLMQEWEQIKGGTYAYYVDDYQLQKPMAATR